MVVSAVGVLGLYGLLGFSQCPPAFGAATTNFPQHSLNIMILQVYSLM